MPQHYKQLASGTRYFDIPGLDSGGFADPSNRTTPTTSVPSRPTTTAPSSGNFFADRNRLGNISAGRISRPGSFVSGVDVEEFGREDFDAALVDWNRVYTDAQQGIPAALELIEQFAPGGGFGAGRRQEARDLIYGGVARDSAAAVAAGQSSISSSRGLNVLAGRELATQFGNIEDARAALQIQAFSPYTQMLSNLAAVGTARPTARQYIDRVSIPQYTTF